MFAREDVSSSGPGAVPAPDKPAEKKGGFRVMRRATFGASPGCAANNLTEEQAKEYIRGQQEANDGAMYTMERDA
jgi:hypothetical protein